MDTPILTADTLYFGSLVAFNSALEPSVGRSSQAQLSTTAIPVMPLPSSPITLLNSSDPLTVSHNVSVGEVLTFLVTVTIPEGTASAPNITVTVPSADGLGELSITDAGIESLPSNFEPIDSYITIHDKNVDGVNDTVVFGFSTLINHPDNVASNNVFTLRITAIVSNSPFNIERQVITTSSVFGYTNSGGRKEIFTSASVKMVSPVLVWNVTWNATNGDAGDVIGCTVAISHDEVNIAFSF